MLHVFSMIINNPEQFFILISSFFKLTLPLSSTEPRIWPELDSAFWSDYMWLLQETLTNMSETFSGAILVQMNSTSTKQLSGDLYTVKRVLFGNHKFTLVGQIHYLTMNCLTQQIFSFTCIYVWTSIQSCFLNTYRWFQDDTWGFRVEFHKKTIDSRGELVPIAIPT